MDFNLLRRRTAEVDEQHRAAMATIDQDLREAHLSTEPNRATSRRGFLARVSGTAIVLGAATVPMSGIFSAASAQDDEADDADGGIDASDEDLAIVAFAETVERAAAAFYLQSIESVRLPSEVEETARAFARHHTDHADALMNLAGGEDPEPREPAPALVDALVPQLVGIELEALITLYYELEEGAAATYYAALGSLESQDVAGAASTILPVEAQHAVVWGQQLDLDMETYVPAFQTDEGAISPDEAGAEGTGDDDADADDEDEDES